VRVEDPVIRRWFWAFENHASAFEAVLHPEIEWFPGNENFGRLHGIDAALRQCQSWLDAWDEHRTEVDELAAEGESVVVAVHLIARGKTSGAEVDVRFYAHFKVRDGKVVYVHDYADRAKRSKPSGCRSRTLRAAARTNSKARARRARDRPRGASPPRRACPIAAP
jgi:ketosteroid isomerase-like protein